MNTFPAKPAVVVKPSSVPPLRTGDGTQLSQTIAGAVISTLPGGATFDHPWRPSLAGSNAVRLQRGLIDGQWIPKIKVDGKLVPMTGDKDGGAPPSLEIDPKETTEDGESWVMLELEPLADGTINKDCRIELVHSKDPNRSHAEQLAREPIALILWKDNAPLMIRPVVSFNFRYQRVVPAPGNGVPQHYFL